MDRIVIEEHIQLDLLGCHRWTGARDRDGYGRAGKDLAHRRAWEDAVGPIPPGMQLHHTCSARDCVFVDHLMLISAKEHGLLDHLSVSGRNRRKRSCVHGHKFDEGNTYLAPDGSRHCRACSRIRQRGYAAKRKSGRTKSRQRPTTRPPNKESRRSG